MADNPSFEQGNGDTPPWTFWNPDGTATIQRVEDIAHKGSCSVLIEGVEERAGTYQLCLYRIQQESGRPLICSGTAHGDRR